MEQINRKQKLSEFQQDFSRMSVYFLLVRPANTQHTQTPALKVMHAYHTFMSDGDFEFSVLLSFHHRRVFNILFHHFASQITAQQVEKRHTYLRLEATIIPSDNIEKSPYFVNFSRNFVAGTGKFDFFSPQFV